LRSPIGWLLPRQLFAQLAKNGRLRQGDLEHRFRRPVEIPVMLVIVEIMFRSRGRGWLLSVNFTRGALLNPGPLNPK
jgi:hypothetical protein